MHELKKEEGLHMFKLGPEHEQPWFCKYRFNPFVDFCIWVLEVDGLRVSPFDQHTARDGTLQTAGLDADGWLSWVKEVVTLQYQLAQASRQPFVQLLRTAEESKV